MFFDVAASLLRDVWHYGFVKKGAVPFDFAGELCRMQKRLVRHPRALQNFPRPDWMDFDPLDALYEGSEEAILQGGVYYGCIVQANSQLFRFFPQKDAPANVIFSDDASVNADPAILESVAEEMAFYKGRGEEVPPRLREVVRALDSERDRRRLVGSLLLDDGREAAVYFATVMVFRRSLPYRQLLGPLLPVVTIPERPGCVWIVPKRYWGKGFIRRFWDGSYEESRRALQNAMQRGPRRPNAKAN